MNKVPDSIFSTARSKSSRCPISDLKDIRYIEFAFFTFKISKYEVSKKCIVILQIMFEITGIKSKKIKNSPNLTIIVCHLI